MKSSLALASIILSLSSPLIHAAPHPHSHPQSSSLQDPSSPQSSSSSSSFSSETPQVLLTISTLNPTNVYQRISHKTIPIDLSGDQYGSYLEGFADLPASDDDNSDFDDQSSSRSSSNNSKNAGLDLRLSSISFTSTGDVDSPICSFRIADGPDSSTSGTRSSGTVTDAEEANDVLDSNDRGANANPNESFGANVNSTGNKRFYGKPFPGGDGRSIMGSQIGGGLDRKVNGVYCIAANRKWGEGEGEETADGLDGTDTGNDDYDIVAAAEAAAAIEDLDGGFDGVGDGDVDVE